MTPAKTLEELQALNAKLLAALRQIIIDEDTIDDSHPDPPGIEMAREILATYTQKTAQ
jgi:hypothetical protein